MKTFLLVSLIFSTAIAKDIPPPNAADQHLLVGKLTSVRPGPVGQSMPPMYTYTLTFEVVEILRGRLNVGDTLDFQYAERTNNPTVFENSAPYVLSARKVRDRMELLNLRLAADTDLTVFRAQAATPPGWQTIAGKLYSPWANLPDAKWPSEVEGPHCEATGRPARPLPEGVTFTIKAMPPEEEIQWTNPDGDGDYQLILENTTDAPVVLEALPARNREPLWDESVIVQIQHRAYPAPGATGNWADTEPTVLPPGESISGVIRAISVNGPQWPRGGNRVIINFILGDHMLSESFYYMSSHHDDMRKTEDPEIERP
ncbi:MAG: hypothetical protein JJU29_20125 [Verrucomicrobia bacterium]|nr:hypothetical protein [Verrucomicrobiota bacterium]MCH8512500.1 hypothetical protein [Kiritimatiellia bacterium]